MDDIEQSRPPPLYEALKDYWIWLIFNITVGLLPIITNYMVFLIENKTFSSSELLASHGDLALVTTALSAEMIGELIHSGVITKNMETLLVFGFCFLVFFFSMILFIIITAAGTKINLDFAATLSVVLFIATIFNGASSKMLITRFR